MITNPYYWQEVKIVSGFYRGLRGNLEYASSHKSENGMMVPYEYRVKGTNGVSFDAKLDEMESIKELKVAS